MKTKPIYKGLLLLIPWLHCALLFAPLYALAAEFLYRDQGSAYYLIQGLLSVAPMALIDLFCRKLVYLWQYLLAVAAVCGGVFLVTGCWILTLVMALVGLVRLVGRVQEEKKELLFDRPFLAAPLVFILPFVLSGIGNRPVIQLASLCFAAVYFVLWFIFAGLTRLEDYVRMNQKMANLPQKRILKTGTVVFAGVAIILLSILLPALLLNFSFIKIDPNAKPATAMRPQTGSVQAGEVPDIEGQLPQAGNPPPAALVAFMEVLSQIVLILAVLFVACLLIYGIYRLTKGFRETVREKNDLIESTASLAEDGAHRQSRKKDLRFLDFSPNAAVRKKYKRAVKAAKKTSPQIWQDPAEIEQAAGMDNPALHRVYEKARYSAKGVRKEDLEGL